MNRLVYDLAWNPRRKEWYLSLRHEAVVTRRYPNLTKQAALREAREHCRDAARFRPVQLIVRNRDGRIAFENTYQNDPPSRVG